jgi:hypothetical protein
VTGGRRAAAAAAAAAAPSGQRGGGQQVNAAAAAAAVAPHAPALLRRGTGGMLSDDEEELTVGQLRARLAAKGAAVRLDPSKMPAAGLLSGGRSSGSAGSLRNASPQLEAFPLGGRGSGGGLGGGGGGGAGSGLGGGGSGGGSGGGVKRLDPSKLPPAGVLSGLGSPPIEQDKKKMRLQKR